MIPYGRQQIDKKDIEEVVKVLNSDFITQGPVVEKFEKKIAQVVKSSYALTVNSATSALHLACLALGLKQGDHLWTSPNSFLASANCGLYCGASIDFVDIDPGTFNMCSGALEEKLIVAKKQNLLPKIVIPVHFGGEPSEMKRIWELSKDYGFRIIEDASHAIGSSYRKKMTGSCEYSDITVFSFHPVKIITTGEGGVAVTNNLQDYSFMKECRSHGVVRDSVKFVNKSEGSWYYEQQELGMNYRMADILAALGMSQLLKLDTFITKRESIASNYDLALKEAKISTQTRNQLNRSSMHLYVLQVPKSDRAKLYNILRKKGIGVNVHYIPIHLQPFYRKRGFKAGDFPKAEKYYSQALSIPIFPSLRTEDQHFIIENLLEYFR